MSRTALVIAIFLFSLAVPGLCQPPELPAPPDLSSLRQRAERGDADAQYDLGVAYDLGIRGAARDYAEALRWYRLAAAQGKVSARFALARMYTDGKGVERNYDQAAYWYGCPKPSSEILGSCKAISYKDLPKEATALLSKLNCTVGPGDNYDSGSAVDLNGDGTPEYQFCCHPAPHGPCGSVLIGKMGTAWQNLSASTGWLLGYLPACGFVVVLANRTEGFHDICLPNACSTFSTETCVPTIWRFTDGRYRSIDTSATPRN